MQMKLTISWIDNRINYMNLKDDDNLNTLSPQEKNMIWMPTLVFTNTKYREEANFKNESTFATIKINAGITVLDSYVNGLIFHHIIAPKVNITAYKLCRFLTKWKWDILWDFEAR